MPQTTTSDADSRPREHHRSGVVTAIDTLFVGTKRIDHSMWAAFSIDSPRERQESAALHHLSQEKIIGPCRRGRHRTPIRQTHSRASRCEAPRHAPRCLLLHHAGQTSPCNQPSQSAGREERESVVLRNLSKEDVIGPCRDTNDN